MKSGKTIIENILALADIKINGSRPQDIKILDEKAYAELIDNGSIGAGESYVNGLWEANSLEDTVSNIFTYDLYNRIPKNWSNLLHLLRAKLVNNQNKDRSFEVGEKHYDAGNDLYKIMLDEKLVYTCAYWKNATSLDQAQKDKLDLICKKIGLKKGDHVLDIGCGWGSFAKFAAENYGAKVTGVTVSKEQIKLGEELCGGLDVEFMLKDYRDIEGKFDHIVSIGMFEHVGYKNYKTFFDVADRCLKDDGLFLLHTIGNQKSSFATDPWINKYIFPNGNIPSLSQIATVCENKFVIEDVHNFSYYYYLTLKEWHKNFKNNWHKISDNYDNKFYRMWEYYLLVCAGAFKSRHLQLFQLVLSKKGVKGGYESIR